MHNVHPVRSYEPETKLEKFLDKHDRIRSVFYFFEDIWDKVTFYNLRRRLKFAFDYGRFAFKHQYDFDYCYIFSILEFKLSRMRDSMNRTIRPSEATRALELAVKLAKRLYENDYGKRVHDEFDKKWGQSKTIFPRVKDEEDGREYTTIEWVYEDMSEEAEIKRREETFENMIFEEKMRQRDADWLFGIMSKYIWGWWD